MIQSGVCTGKIQLLSFALVLAVTSLAVPQASRAPTRNRQRGVQANQLLTAEEVASKYLPGVVLIICDDGIGKTVQGSGFFISPGLVVTNYHLIKGMVRGYVKLAPLSGRTRTRMAISSILDFDSGEDLALLSVAESPTLGLLPEVSEMLAISKVLKGETAIQRPTTRGSSSDPLGIDAFLEKQSIPHLAPSNQTVKLGEKIYALGNPLGLEGTISEGIVSGFRQSGASRLLQITTPISAGSSGGPVLNTSGLVVGVVTASIDEGQNLNFAVPSQSIRKLVPRFVAEGYPVGNSAPGSWKTPAGLPTP